MAVKILVQIVGQFLLQSLKLGFGVFHISLELHHLLQALHHLLTLGIIGETAFQDTLLELGIVGIRQREVLGRSYRGMTLNVIHHVFQHHLRRVTAGSTEIVGDIGQ